ncbi:hypothetical protein [Actinomadura sp. 9N407]|uniref:hypothetical protein n=1 Tax=Actinomadura sp. 9N407 TaxID=3375154 RepID=UPI0037B3A629
MGTWVYIRGWLEFSGQKAEAKRIILDNGEGWSFPEGGWLDAACYARAVRAQHADEVLAQIRKVAALSANEDNDHVCGLFLAFHEVDGQFEWQVRDGDVFISSAPERYDYMSR